MFEKINSFTFFISAPGLLIGPRLLVFKLKLKLEWRNPRFDIRGTIRGALKLDLSTGKGFLTD